MGSATGVEASGEPKPFSVCRPRHLHQPSRAGRVDDGVLDAEVEHDVAAGRPQVEDEVAGLKVALARRPASAARCANE